MAKYKYMQYYDFRVDVTIYLHVYILRDVPTLVGGGWPSHYSATFNHHSS